MMAQPALGLDNIHEMGTARMGRNRNLCDPHWEQIIWHDVTAVSLM